VTSVVSMRIRVRLFAIQRELAETREVTLDLADGVTVEEAWAAVVELHPVLAPGRSSTRFARNGEYVDADAALRDGDDLAFIPPVSGGSTGGGRVSRSRILELRAEPFEADVLGRLERRLATPSDGAVVGFVGRTRKTPGTPAPGQEIDPSVTDRSVEGLEYEALEPMALRILETIADEVEARFGVSRLAIVHRVGSVPLGEPSVAIVACAEHRGAAFDAARYAIDETKARAPIWKAEHFADGHVWIGEPARTAGSQHEDGP
jgi:molybdopterin synthase catalytic subunit